MSNKKGINENGKIEIPIDLQEKVFRFFLKTSMPRIAKQKRESQQEIKNNALSDMEGQTNK